MSSRGHPILVGVPPRPNERGPAGSLNRRSGLSFARGDFAETPQIRAALDLPGARQPCSRRSSGILGRTPVTVPVLRAVAKLLAQGEDVMPQGCPYRDHRSDGPVPRSGVTGRPRCDETGLGAHVARVPGSSGAKPAWADLGVRGAGVVAFAGVLAFAR